MTDLTKIAQLESRIKALELIIANLRNELATARSSLNQVTAELNHARIVNVPPKPRVH